MSGKNKIPVWSSDKPLVAKLRPEVTIRGQPMEVTSVVEDGHGVVWVCVEPADKYRRLRSSVRRQMEMNDEPLR